MLVRVNNQAELDVFTHRAMEIKEHCTVLFGPGRYLYVERLYVDKKGAFTFQGEGEVYLEGYVSSFGQYSVNQMHARFFGSAEIFVCGGEVEAYNECHVYAYGGKIKAGPNVIVETTDLVLSEITGGVLYHRDTKQYGLAVEKWMKHYGLELNEDGTLTVYKGVDHHYFSRHGWRYLPGSMPFAPDWEDTTECGAGLHFSPTPHLTSVYCYPKRYMACRILPGEAVTLGDKIKAYRVMPPGCVEVDILGREISQDA